MPEVSVLMCVYNDAPYLRESIDSVLSQDFSDFEFIIVDDGSTDETPAILDSYTDARIVRLLNPENRGLTISLKRGMERASGRYVARIDANDIAAPGRLTRQVEFLEAHPEVGVLSGDMLSMDVDGVFREEAPSMYSTGASHEYLCWLLLWTNPIAHITVMMRKSVFDEHHINYVPEFNRAEDYELWATLAQHTQLLRLSEVYAYRRVILTGVSFTRRDTQLGVMYQVASREIKRLLGEDVSDLGMKTFFDALHRGSNRYHDYRAATDVVIAAYRHFMKQPLIDADRTQIHADTVGYLLKISRRARAYSRLSALIPLWKLRGISRREFFSRNMLGMVWGALLRRTD
jgi:glycosyltransferase involved in cell wall biosynthesis